MADQRKVMLRQGHGTPSTIILRDLPVADAAPTTTIYLYENHATPQNIILRDPTAAPVAPGGIAYFGSASVPADNGSNATATLTITPPVGMVQGDLVIVHCESRTATPTWSVGVTGGQTWTSEAAFFNGRIFWCTFSGTWGADPRFDCTLSACTSAVMHVFNGQGAGYEWQEDVAFAGFNASGPITTCTVTGVTTLTDNAIAVAGWDVQSARTWSNLAGAGWAVAGEAQYRNTAQSDQSLSHAYYLAPTAGATGDVSKDKDSSTGGFDSWIMAWKNVVSAGGVVIPIFDHYYRMMRSR